MKTTRRSARPRTAKIIPLPDLGLKRVNGTHRAVDPAALNVEPSLAAKPAAPLPATVVEARIDVGLGNTLFIRGQGAGLSWEKGEPLTCIAADRWTWRNEQLVGKLCFKLLLNDSRWALGENLEVDPGQTLRVIPAF